MNRLLWFLILVTLAPTAHAISLALLPPATPDTTDAVVSTDDPLTLLPTSSVTQMRAMLGGRLREQETIAAALQLTLAIPARPTLAPLRLQGAGTVPFRWHGTAAAVRPHDLPTLRGTIAALHDHHVMVDLHAMRGAPLTIGFTNGALTVSPLGWNAVVRSSTTQEPLLQIALPATPLTTGTVTINHMPVHGSLNLDDRSATLVGVFIMPATGLAPVDQQVAGAQILVSLRVQVQK